MAPRIVGDHLDRLSTRYLVRHGLIPGFLVLGAMALAQLVVGIVLLAWEAAIVSTVWTRILALGFMFVAPHVAVGYRTGSTVGMSPVAPVVGGIAPVVAIVVALVAFGGPVDTTISAPLLLAGAVVAWSLLFTIGMLAGDERLDWHRLLDG